MTDANTHAINAHLAEIEAHEAEREPCPECDDSDCMCAEEAALDAADHAHNMRKEDGL